MAGKGAWSKLGVSRPSGSIRATNTVLAAAADAHQAVRAAGGASAEAKAAANAAARQAGAVPRNVERRGFADNYRKLANGVRDADLDYIRDPKSFRPGSFASAEREFSQPGRSATEIAKTLGHPIRIDIMPNGKLHLNDGRHRLAVARAKGATAIRTRVVQYGARGSVRWDEEMILPLR